MPDRLVTPDAVVWITLDLAVPDDIADELFVAAQAIVLDSGETGGCDLNRFVKILKRESPGMPCAMFGLRPVFAENILWNVTIIAHSDGMMRRFLPGIKLVAHDMAIGASGWVVGEIRPPPRLDERESAGTRENA